MDKFLKNFSSPVFWITAIIVGVISQVFSDYIREGLDKLSGKAFYRFRESSAKFKAMTEASINQLVEHPEDMSFILFESVRRSLIITWGFMFILIFLGFLIYRGENSPVKLFGERTMEGVFFILSLFVLLGTSGLAAVGEVRANVVHEARRRIFKKREGEHKKAD